MNGLRALLALCAAAGHSAQADHLIRLDPRIRWGGCRHEGLDDHDCSRCAGAHEICRLSYVEINLVAAYLESLGVSPTAAMGMIMSQDDDDDFVDNSLGGRP